jgi:peptidyl-tRNA hydrolase
MGRNKAGAVRSARPKGKRCRHKLNILPYSDVVIMVSAYFMNNSGKKTLELLKPLDIIKRISY